MTSTSYPSRVLAGLMSESQFFGFLSIYAVPESTANPISAMREAWARSAAAFEAGPPYIPEPMAGWDPAWGDPETFDGRPGLQSIRRQHTDSFFGSAPVNSLLVVHPSLDLEQADYWATRLADAGAVAAPPRNEAPATYSLEDDSQTVRIRARYALLGAYFTAKPDADSPLPRVGLHWQPGINLIQVGRLGERHIIINGHHRAYALARAGATHVPCITYEIPDLEIVGLSEGDRSYKAMQSERPPRLIHYLDPQMAVMVQLRRSTRVVTLKVSEETIQER
jgi:hypothetical protein